MGLAAAVLPLGPQSRFFERIWEQDTRCCRVRAFKREILQGPYPPQNLLFDLTD